MKHEEATSSHADDDDLESHRVAAVKAPDLVASLVHVSRDDQLPPSSTITTVRTGSTPTHQLQVLQQQQYVVPRVDELHHFQISQITKSSTLKTSAVSSRHNSRDSPALDNARLIEPFSPDYPPQEFDSEGRDLVPVAQFAPSGSAITTLPQGGAALPTSQKNPSVPPKSQANLKASSKHTSKMFFGDMQKNSAVAHRRRSMASTSALTDYEADLTSKDRVKQKDAIKKVLASKVRDDWSWTWPREINDPGTPIINQSQESLVEEDWTERAEWDSNESEIDEESIPTIADSPAVVESPNGKDPFRFDSPDGVGDSLRKTAEDRKTRRRRRLYEEMLVNDGLSCFIHRRNAWTCARHARRPSRPSSTIATPLKRAVSRKSPKSSPAGPAPTPPTPTQPQEDKSFPLDFITEIPIAPPILPPETPFRKGITDRAYSTIYDKVILQSQTPFCPINLSDITKSCVEGWKRDGEWPIKPIGGADAVIAEVKKASNGLGAGAGRVGEGTGTGSPGGSAKNKGVLRRSLQKVMGAVRERAGSKGKEEDFLTPVVRG